MENLSTLDIVLGITVIVAFIGFMTVIVLQHRQTGGMVAALTAALESAGNNTQALDLAEKLATKVVPISAVKGLNQAADLIETFTPDDVDALIEGGRKLLNAITDGKPNVAPTTNSLAANKVLAAVADSMSIKG